MEKERSKIDSWFGTEYSLLAGVVGILSTYGLFHTKIQSYLSSNYNQRHSTIAPKINVDTTALKLRIRQDEDDIQVIYDIRDHAIQNSPNSKMGIVDSPYRLPVNDIAKRLHSREDTLKIARGKK